MQDFKDSLILLLGFGGGYFFTVYILGYHFDNLMKAAIDEIHKGYLKALKLQEEKIRKEYEEN